MSEAAPHAEQPPSPQDQILRDETRNLSVMSLQDTVLRIGWIFKTESVIMPAFMDRISGSPVLRGMLPILSRLGQSVIPLLSADIIRRQPVKKRTLVLTGFLMALPFLTLSAIWLQIFDKPRNWWFPLLFLTLYFLFFSATGLNQLAYGSLQGKLIRPFRRGRLMAIGGTLGSIGAVTAAVLWLRPWLMLPLNRGYVWIFLFNGSIFFISGVVSQFCREPPDPPRTTALPVRRPFRDAWQLYRSHLPFRRAARVTMLFICTILLFPHYQWLARERLGADNSDLFNFVIAQNIAVGVLSPVMGWIADRWGNRLAIRLEVFAAACTPLLALVLSGGTSPSARHWYILVFVFLGLTPVTMRTILNYTLELTEPADHARYQSTMTLCFAVPFVFSPLLGFAITDSTYPLAFMLTSALIATGGVLTFWMHEPRQELTTPADSTPGAANT